MQHVISTASSAGKHAVASPQVLIVSPTRELALQTAETLSSLCDLLGYKCVCLFGGMPKTQQVQELRQPGLKVVVGTPGRVLDLVNDGAVKFDKSVSVSLEIELLEVKS